MKVLFAADLTEPDSLTRWIQNLALGMKGELFILHVRVPTPGNPVPIDPMTGFGDVSFGAFDPQEEARIESAEQSDLDAFLRRRFDVPVRSLLRVGDPSAEILKAAESIDADLIVVGKRHHTALERFLLGCVSSAVLNHTERPMLVLPIPEQAG